MTSKRKKLKKDSLKKSLRILRYFSPYKAYFFLGVFFLLLSSLATLAFPFLLGGLLDQQSTYQINKLALTLLAIFFANAVFSFFRIYLFEIVTQKALANLRVKAYSNLIALPIMFFNQRRVGELTSRLSSDIALLQTTFTSSAAEFLRQILTIVGGIFMLSAISFRLTLFMLAVVPVIAIIAFVFGKFIGKLSKQTQKEIANSNTIIEETLQAITTVKAFTNEAFEVNRYKGLVKNIVDVSLKNAKFRGGFVSFIIFGLFGAIIGVIWYGLLLKESGEISQGDLFSFVIYTVFVGASFGGIADIYSQLVKATAATENLLDIIDEPAETLPEISPNQKIILHNKIQFNQVTFAYPNRKENNVLHQLNLEIQKGKKVALVGASGAGKSTIMALMMRLYSVNSGEILWDNQNFNTLNLSTLRETMGLVPQDVMLFGGTIKENILYGNIQATDEQIIEAAKKAHAHHFISDFPEGYQTLVGERGVQLSGGQRQRIAIARAVLKNPQILLLDEATSSLDSASENEVQLALNELMKNRTSLIIAHRLSTIKNADVIYVLKNGCVVEKGTYAELTANEFGDFNKLVKLQTNH